MTRRATCACGQLSVQCVGEPFIIAQCHCLACQKRTGSTYGVAAFFNRGDVTPQGQARPFTRTADSGYSVTFHFCPDCGSTVYWEPRRLPELIAVAVGCFSDSAFPAPSRSVYEQQRHAWVVSHSADR